jgi:hypothetical protein
MTDYMLTDTQKAELRKNVENIETIWTNFQTSLAEVNVTLPANFSTTATIDALKTQTEALIALPTEDHLAQLQEATSAVQRNARYALNPLNATLLEAFAQALETGSDQDTLDRARHIMNRPKAIVSYTENITDICASIKHPRLRMPVTSSFHSL